MRLIFVAPPHTETTGDFAACAFTQNLMTLCEALTNRGVDTVLLSGEENEASCGWHIDYYSSRDRHRWFGEFDKTKTMNIDWSDTPAWREANLRAAAAMVPLNLDPRNDIIMLSVGSSQSRIMKEFQNITSVEYAVGYEGTTAPYRVYCSLAWKNFLAGKQSERFGPHDTVIHHYTEPQKWINIRHDDYVLFVGRIFRGKGPQEAAAIARASGRKLILAGTGVKSVEADRIHLDDGSFILGNQEEIEYVGPVNKSERSTLMRDAYATIVPTQYFEPFGLVAIESTMLGTPVLTTNWGAFPETILPEMGSTFSSLNEGIAKLELLGDLDRLGVHMATMDNYSTTSQVPKYIDYLSSLLEHPQPAWQSGFARSW